MTTVILIDGPSDPFATLCRLWDASKTDGPIPDRTPSEQMEMFDRLLLDGVPCIQHLNFTFELNDVPISLREQMVRHRVGVKHGDRVGADMVPDIAESSWWSQSMRVLNMSDFEYHTPDTIGGQDVSDGDVPLTARELYDALMEMCRESYSMLVAAGVPMEDARNVIPLAATHRVTWTINLLALKNMIGKRGCWILQLGLWGDVIKGMINELCAYYGTSIFRKLITPPCMRGDTYKGCVFPEDNDRRIDGDDTHLPPCSLYMSNEIEGVHRGKWACTRTAVQGGSGVTVRLWSNASDLSVHNEYHAMQKRYQELWNRDTLSGVTLSK